MGFNKSVIIFLVAAFCAGLLLSPPSGRGKYAPKILLVKVMKSSGDSVSFDIEGKKVSNDRDALGEILRDASISAGFFGNGLSGPANCRLVVQAGKNVRWAQIRKLFYCCTANCIYDVYLKSGNLVFPVNFHCYALSPENSLGHPDKVLLRVLWTEQSSDWAALSEKGNLTIYIQQIEETTPFKPLPIIRPDGTLIIQYLDEEKVHKTNNWDTARQILQEAELSGSRVLIWVGQMVPFSEVVEAIRACRGCGGGYELLAPPLDWDFDESK